MVGMGLHTVAGKRKVLLGCMLVQLMGRETTACSIVQDRALPLLKDPSVG